jgi:hypothetical protein
MMAVREFGTLTRSLTDRWRRGLAGLVERR